MKIISFLFSLLLFLVYLLNNNGRREEEQKETHFFEETEKPDFNHIEDFYSNRLDTLNKMLFAARQEERREQAKLDHINTLNQYGIIINEKNVKRAETELYKAMRKRLAIENAIHTTEKAMRKEDRE